MPTAVKGRRPYSTKLRAEQAELTRQRVLDAARVLFVRDGYADVTMQAVASEARVAYQTVYSQFGNKLQLALELCASEFPHIGPTVAQLVEARDRRDPEAWLRMMGTFARQLYEPCAEILRFMRQSGDASLIERYDEIQAGRMHHLKDLGPQLEKSRRLRRGLTAGEAVELTWMLAGPETYEALVLGRGWKPQRFETWLNETLPTLVLKRR